MPTKGIFSQMIRTEGTKQLTISYCKLLDDIDMSVVLEFNEGLSNHNFSGSKQIILIQNMAKHTMLFVIAGVVREI